MFRQRVVILFPSIKRSVAEETRDIVGIGLEGMIKETGFGKLNACQKVPRNKSVADY